MMANNLNPPSGSSSLLYPSKWRRSSLSDPVKMWYIVDHQLIINTWITHLCLLLLDYNLLGYGSISGVIHYPLIKKTNLHLKLLPRCCWTSWAVEQPTRRQWLRRRFRCLDAKPVLAPQTPVWQRCWHWRCRRCCQSRRFAVGRDIRNAKQPERNLPVKSYQPVNSLHH